MIQKEKGKKNPLWMKTEVWESVSLSKEWHKDMTGDRSEQQQKKKKKNEEKITEGKKRNTSNMKKCFR